MLFIIVSVFWSLKDNYDEALKRDDVKAIVITSMNSSISNNFIDQVSVCMFSSVSLRFHSSIRRRASFFGRFRH